MPDCVLCGDNTFDEFDGNFFCSNCGTQTQELRNEADVEADTENLGFGHSQQRQLVSKREKSKRGSKYAESDVGKPWLTYEAIQCLLKAQVKALVDLGVDPELKNTVCQIWFHFLRKTKVAFTGALSSSRIAIDVMRMRRDVNLGQVTPLSTKLKKDVQGEKLPEKEIAKEVDNTCDSEEDMLFSPSDDDESSCSDLDNSPSELSDGECDEKEHVGSLRYKHEFANCNWTILQHRHTVVFIYIGLLFLKEPVTVADILRLISRGHIPYHRMSKVLPSHMKFSKEDMSTFSYRPLNVKKIHDGTNFLINFLDLPKVPAPDFFLLVAKLILDFQLPAAVHRLSVSLIKASEYEPRTNFKHPRCATYNEYYEEMAAAFIVVAVKLIYGLDGETEKNGDLLTKYLDVPVEEIDCWNCIMLRLEKKRKNDVVKNYPKCESDLSYLQSCESYALYCSEEVLRDVNSMFASRQKLNCMHSQYRACLNDAKEEYYRIMKEAVVDLEEGKAKEFTKLSPCSFVYDHIPRVEAIDASCNCRQRSGSIVLSSGSNENSSCTMAGKGLGQGSEPRSKTRDTYSIYLNDISGLKVHDSYRYLLDVFSRRILIRPVELQEFVTYVETMLFVDPTL